MRKRLFITEVDTINHVAFSDCGAILEIDSYVDEEETPCLPEEATHAFVKTGANSFQKVLINDEDEYFDEEEE